MAIKQFTAIHTWRDHYSEEDMPEDLVDPVAGRMHVDHCIETLRLSLMCYGDITPVLIYEDAASAIGRRADFNTHHKCRNFDKIRDFVEEQYKESALIRLHEHGHG